VQGFTLIELLVVLGLFSGIATISLGALFNAQSINARLQESQAILDNVNLSTQTIARDIRFGSEFYCTTSLPLTSVLVPTIRKSCPYGVGLTGGGTVLIFRPAETSTSTDRVAYYLKNGVLYREDYPRNAASSTLQMTSNEVTIKSITFFVDGAQKSDGSNDDAGASDYKQPLISILISGDTKPTMSSVKPVTFNIQTSVSAREIDNK
jgi:prepilin-type N-terminal cleavage/methylation domain-containing protein